MANSKAIAGLIGPTLLVTGIAVFLNGSLFPQMIEAASADLIIIFLSGFLLFVVGVAIVRVHNVWAAGWPLIITVLGWLCILGGVVRLWFPVWALHIAGWFIQFPAVLIGIATVFLALGAFLTFQAFRRG
jgi:hypothetical protein